MRGLKQQTFLVVLEAPPLFLRHRRPSSRHVPSYRGTRPITRPRLLHRRGGWWSPVSLWGVHTLSPWNIPVTSGGIPRGRDGGAFEQTADRSARRPHCGGRWHVLPGDAGRWSSRTACLGFGVKAVPVPQSTSVPPRPLEELQTGGVRSPLHVRWGAGGPRFGLLAGQTVGFPRLESVLETGVCGTLCRPGRRQHVVVFSSGLSFRMRHSDAPTAISGFSCLCLVVVSVWPRSCRLWFTDFCFPVHYCTYLCSHPVSFPLANFGLFCSFSVC